MGIRGILLCSLAAGIGIADVKLPAVISTHMVVQQGTPVRLWGKADPGEQVTAKLAGKSASAVADASGKWKLALPKLRAGGPHTLTVSGKNSINIEDVLVGEVWVASGQSNMEWPIDRSMNPDQEKAAANDTQIRFFRVKNTTANEPAEDVEAVWELTSPQTAGAFSGVAYFFARELRKARNSPVGILQSDWGGTPAESWTSKEALEAKGLPQVKDVKRTTPQWGVSALYNAMIAPLTPYAMRGAIWYQGESNAGTTERSREYNLLFRTMIEDWRRAWGLGDFPFLFVQLAGFAAGATADWPLVRESQNAALSLKNTGLAVAIDIGEEKDIHPKNKQEVGRRLALAARSAAYREKLEYSGPMYRSMKRKGNGIEIRFSHAKGLQAKGGEPQSFLIAGADKKFVPASAEIKGSSVIVRADGVAEPAAVRYGWKDWTPANLYNGAGLPASPFRTDDWPETK